MPSDDSGNPIWATNNPNNPTVYSAIPDRPHGFVFDNPRTTKDKIENLKKQPVIVDLMGSLPGRFIGYRTPSPADLAKAVAEKEKQKESHEGTVYQSDDETNDGLFLDDFPVTSQEEEMD
jgi:hypothetical protein